MDAEDARLRLSADAYLYPPMQIFESEPRAPHEILSLILERCGNPGSSRIGAHPPHLWFGFLKNREGLAFYGSALRSPSSARDIDLLCVSPLALPQYHLKPDIVHIHGLNMDSSGPPNEAGLLFSGPLLFLSEPPRNLASFIESARAHMLSSPFFEWGVGELITHAAFKALEKGEGVPSGTPGDVRLLRLMVRYQWCDLSSMATKIYSPHEQNNQVRHQMQGMKDEEVYSLALAGMRRIRVKEEGRKGLAERFVKELRKKKIHGSFG